MMYPFTNKKQQENIKSIGCYSGNIETGFKVISINSLFICKRNKLLSEEAVNVVIDFLRDELESAFQKKEKVLLISHIPVVSSESSIWLNAKWIQEYQNLMKKYQSQVVGSLFGHDHTSFFNTVNEVDENGVIKPFSVQFASGAISPIYVNINPGIKIFKYDKHTFELLDYIQIFNDFEKSNLPRERIDNNWHIAFDSFLETFEVKDLSPQSVQDLIEKFKEDEYLYEKFLESHHVNFYDHNYCKGECKKKMICQLQYYDEKDYKICIDRLEKKPKK